MKRLLITVAGTAGPPLAFFALFILLWAAAVRAFAIPPFLLPGPQRVALAVLAHLPALLRATSVTGLGVVAVAFIISIFPIIANTTAGLLAVDRNLVDLFVLNNASRWQVLRKLRIPNAVPNLLTGAKISSGLSAIGAIVGEFFAGYGTDDFGLGYLIILTNGQAKTDYLFACILFCTLLGLSIFASVSALSGIVLKRWGDGNR